jgi:threonine aldolase
MNIVDLRSDTVTHPTPTMRQAMATADVGDDVLGEDPTINRLQTLAAQKMGKEAGLFVPSGTMGNLAAVLAHCGRGDEAVMGNLGHTFLFEAGGISALGGVFVHTLPNQPDGTLRMEELRSAVRPDDIHHPVSKLVILENTHNRCGGVVLPVEYTRAVADFAHENGMKLHLDGARIFNAAAALGVAASDLAGPADSVTFCLSKGLCAPVGSVLCGSADFIHAARRIRKQLGGGMRQAGILAAAGIVAVEEMTERLVEDHQRARRLAEGLKAIPGIRLDMGMPQTNMVFASLEENIPVKTRAFVEQLAKQEVKIGVVGDRRFRMVIHYWINDEGIDQTIRAFRQTLANL